MRATVNVAIQVKSWVAHIPVPDHAKALAILRSRECCSARSGVVVAVSSIQISVFDRVDMVGSRFLAESGMQVLYCLAITAFKTVPDGAGFLVGAFNSTSALSFNVSTMRRASPA